MWLNVDTMPLQTLVDKVARSKMLTKIGWKIEDETSQNDARIVYEVCVGTNQIPQKRIIYFKDICEMFEWKWFTIHPSRQTILVEHTAKHLRDLSQ